MHLFRQLASTSWQLPSIAEPGWGAVRGAGDWHITFRGVGMEAFGVLRCQRDASQEEEANVVFKAAADPSGLKRQISQCALWSPLI